MSSQRENMSRNTKPVAKNASLASRPGAKQLNCATPSKVVAKPKAAVVDYADDGDYFEEEGFDEFGASVEEGDLNSDFQNTEMGQDVSGAELAANNQGEGGMTAEERAAEAPIKWDIAEFEFDHVFDLSELITSTGKGSIKTLNKGHLSLSVANKLLKVGYRSHNPDFLPAKEEVATKDTKKKISLADKNTALGDIVKYAKLVGFQMTGYDGAVVVHLKSIPKFQEEGHADETDHVNFRLMPHMWKNNMSHSIDLFGRTITISMMDFQKRFPGLSPENLMADVQRARGDRFLVPLNNPIVALINRDRAAINTANEENTVVDGKYVNPSLVATNQVLIPKELVKRYKPETLDAMKKGMSYANISDRRFEISFELPIPSHLQAHHDEFKESNGVSGRQFLYWADTPYKSNPMALGSALPDIKSKDLLFKDPGTQTVRLQGKFVLGYKRQTKEVPEEF